ncbi:MAG: undecaprenyl-phosphate alpha-N-acetylglucosaminyl 1-phosphate transferase [Gammaproteobacteria bacterium]|nr:undecaprenyl-phosphate alpha-N-acetylglucosaminyl 1-phosphate transferase [Gammaproteobacteria bacterium]
MILQTLITAIFFTYFMAWLTPRFGLVDSPGGRKDHQGDIPLAGGIAIFLTVAVCGWQLHIPLYTPQLILVATIPFLVGVVDDRVHIHAGWRLVIHYGCGLVMATFGGVAIYNVGKLLTFGDISLLLLSAPLTALSVAGLCNAYNMIDGIDGLAASLVAIPLLVLLALAGAAGHPMASVLVLLLIPLGVFLCLNLGPNKPWLPKVFLGDAGSVTLGFMLTASLVYFSQGDQAVIKPVTALWLVTVPLMDMLATMLRRVKRGLSPMEPDKSHLHHILMRMGLGPRQTLLLMLGYAAGCAVLGLALETMPESFSLLVYHLVFFCHCGFVIKAQRIGGAVRRRLGKPLLSE